LLRPCRFCVADWAEVNIKPSAEDCEWRHRDDPRVYNLARALAETLQQREPSDRQTSWFLGDADQVVDDFDPVPECWKVRRLPAGKNDGYDGIEVRLRINGVTYVALEGGKDCAGDLLRLSKFREANRA
jgi:hypothetical protein